MFLCVLLVRATPPIAREAPYLKRGAEITSWLNTQRHWDGYQMSVSTFQFCSRQVLKYDPAELDVTEAIGITAELSKAVMAFDEMHLQTKDFTYGDAQWLVFRMVLDWLREWDLLYRKERALDPANFTLQFPIMFQFMAPFNKALSSAHSSGLLYSTSICR